MLDGIRDLLQLVRGLDGLVSAVINNAGPEGEGYLESIAPGKLAFYHRAQALLADAFPNTAGKVREICSVCRSPRLTYSTSTTWDVASQTYKAAEPDRARLPHCSVCCRAVRSQEVPV